MEPGQRGVPPSHLSPGDAHASVSRGDALPSPFLGTSPPLSKGHGPFLYQEPPLHLLEE